MTSKTTWNVKLITTEHDTVPGELLVESLADHSSQITLHFLGKKIIGHADYPFRALVEVRKQLETEGLLIACNGARRDVYPSGMSLPGYKAYILEMGKQATQLVVIFDEAEIATIATVGEQKKYWEAWLSFSLNN